MKKKLMLLALLSFFLVTFANAQIKQPTMVESMRDTLYPEIVLDFGWPDIEHFQHPATELRCITGGPFATLQEYSQYLWEVDSCFMPYGGTVTDPSIWCVFDHPGYIKVYVWDSVGNFGCDSIYFDIKDWVTPMENFQMEIDNTGHAVFSGIATDEHWGFFTFRSLDTVNWWLACQKELTPGPWTWRDDEAHFGVDTVWNYQPFISDTCNETLYPAMVPGMMMGTQPAPGGGWYLTMRTFLQARDDENYVYPLFTVDSLNNRHPFIRDDEQVVLPASTNAYLIPDRHPDAYYQGAVAKLTPGKDSGYEILSYSNKVENPLPDVDAIDDHQETTFKIYPNPSSGTFIVETDGLLHVTNVLGQSVRELEVHGHVSVTLPRGVYIIRNGDVVKKVVVN